MFILTYTQDNYKSVVCC